VTRHRPEVFDCHADLAQGAPHGLEPPAVTLIGLRDGLGSESAGGSGTVGAGWDFSPTTGRKKMYNACHGLRAVPVI